MTLRDALQDWCEWDVAAFRLAQSLGLMNPTARLHLEAKHVFWTDNAVGGALHVMLGTLCEAGVLERDGDNRFRWNPSFKDTWE
jgi:hypothetical protein